MIAMHHTPCPHDRSSFASLVHILGSLQLHSSVEPLRANGVRSATQLENTPKHQLRLWIGDPAIDRLFNRSVVRAQSRAEAPVVHPYQRGSRQAAAAVQGEGALAKADEAFQEDKFAKSSRGPRESRWKLWCSLAEQRNLPPLPVTVDLIDKVGALLKQARYRSAAQYYSVAKSEHRAHGHDWPASLDHAVAQAVRSITRGMGPSSAKLDFPLEVCSRSFDGDVVRAYSTLQVPEHARIEAPADTGIVASWFLLRGLEISSVVCEDIAFARDGLVKLHLPVSKVDPTARGCHRSHACICERRHDPGCYRSGDEALLFTPTMEASYSEAGSMSIFWTQNRALKTTSLARVPIRIWWDPVGPSSSLRWDPNRARWDRWVPALLYVGPKSGSVGRGGTRWVPALLYVGPYTPFGFYNAN